METTTYIALSRQFVLRRNMDIIANNIANMTSSGYRAEALLVEPARVDAGGRQRLAYVQDVAMVRDLSPGPLVPTGNPLDLAIQGAGYFEIATAAGPRYSRGGQFRLNEAGELTTAAGDPVLAEGGPLLLPADLGGIAIAEDGTITGRDGVLGRLTLVTFADEQALRKAGAGLYATDQAPAPAAEADLRGTPPARVLQGMLESSNVRPIVEMTEMMATVRAYQGTQKLIDAHHEMQRQSIERMLEVSS